MTVTSPSPSPSSSPSVPARSGGPASAPPARVEMEFVRDGVLLPVPRWGGFHQAAAIIVVTTESGEGPFPRNTPDVILGRSQGYAYRQGKPVTLALPFSAWSPLWSQGNAAVTATPLRSGHWTVTRSWIFTDPMDGEILHFRPGDEIRLIPA